MKRMLLHIVTCVTLLSISTLNFAQVIPLGTAADFVLFTSTGAVGNTGVSHLTGNVGSNTGSSTGFGNVNGVMHNNNGATDQARQDLLIAYGLLESTPHTFVHAPLLGNGDTLIGGVYSVSGLTTLSGDLFLDAQGNSNTVFIFKIGAEFFTTAESKVKMINGAQACNIFWKVEGAVSMAAGTSFKGNLIVNNAAITMSTRDTLEGRALSTAGAIAVNGVMAYTPLGCGTPVLTGPAKPDLLSVAAYGVFSGNGSLANSGDSYVAGDVGTNVGLTTGFDPLKVTGTIHPGPDVSTADAARDLLIVYNNLKGVAHDIELLYPAQFGNNLVLTPHTYLMNAATTFTDTLYLNAQGNEEAVFLIKITGALSTTANSNVVLMNGAQAKNVYWLIDGAVNIAPNSTFNGTLIANNGAIDLTSGTTLVGRALTTNGALSTAAIDLAIPGLLLPVNWLYFRGTPAQKNVLLEWGTTNEMNNGFFTIEKSNDGQRFETLTTVAAQGTSGKTEYSYTFTDRQPYSLGYYRISQTDNDGQRKYYNTVQVKMNVGNALKAFHYVQQSSIYVQTSGTTAANASIELYNIEGKRISSQKILLTNNVNIYKIAKPMQKGVYLLTIVSNGQKFYTGKVMVL